MDFLTFVYWRGEVGERFAEALSDRARNGVRVRLLLDGWGAHPIEDRLVDMMEDAGVRVRWFREPTSMRPSKINHRTHRKVVIVDEATAFTGGVGSPTSGRAMRGTRASGATPTSWSVARPSTGSEPPSSTTGPRPTTSCSTLGSTTSPTSPRRATR